MNNFIRGLKIGKELFFISGLAIGEFFFNFFMFIAIGIMIIVSIVFWLIVLAILLGAGS